MPLPGRRGEIQRALGERSDPAEFARRSPIRPGLRRLFPETLAGRERPPGPAGASGGCPSLIRRHAGRLYGACAYASGMALAETSLRVSRETVRELARLQELWNTRSADETIQKLVRERRMRAVAALFGSAKGLSPFSEDDRLQSHY